MTIPRCATDAALPAWLEAPPEVVEQGFFASVRYWLEHTGHLVSEDWVPNRVALIGTYGTDLELKHEINRWLAEQGPTVGHRCLPRMETVRRARGR